MPIDELGDLLLPVDYNDVSGYGFDVIEINKCSIDARYIEKNSYEEKVILPNGSEETINFDRYINFNFSIFKFHENSAFLKIENSPVSLKKFMKFLSDITNRNFFIINKTLNIEKISKMFEEKCEIKNFRVKKIAISNVKITKSGISKIEITSEDNAMEDFLKTFRGKKYKLNRIKISFIINDTSGAIELARTGMIFIDDNIYHMIEEDLPYLITKAF